LSAFIEGAASFLSTFGISAELGTSFIAVIVVSFALTTLDSATRLLRYNVEEIGASLRIRPLRNRFLSTGVAILAIAFFAFYRIDGKPAGLSLWAIFGTVNQLLAGLALLVATLYLLARRRNYLVTGIPMVFMLVTTIVAMGLNIRSFMGSGQWPLLLLTILLAALALWLIIEAWIVIVRRPRAE
jgi:carbon starvation protein